MLELDITEWHDVLRHSKERDYMTQSKRISPVHALNRLSYVELKQTSNSFQNLVTGRKKFHNSYTTSP